MPRTIVLGYSGGLDTSIIVPWLTERYDAAVICMVGGVGQHVDPVALRRKALASGAADIVFEDLRADFIERFVWPTLRAGAVYGRKYLLGTAMARPVIARRQVEVARRFGADAVAHGCTGRGNDQVRFELTFGALAPDLEVIAPWREWDIESREDALAYAHARGISLEGVDQTKLYSRDENLWHISHEGGPLEDPAFEAEESMYRWTTAPEAAPDRPETVDVRFESGVPVAIDGEPMDAVSLVETLNALGSRHGVGRADIVEDRLVGMKSRGVYETPGGTILYEALQDLESITLDRRTAGLKDQLAPRYADLVYEGRWWSPEREALDATVDALMEPVTGRVRVKLFKGSARAVSREAESSLYRPDLATFGASATFDHADAEGFIRLFGLPVRVAAAARGPTPTAPHAPTAQQQAAQQQAAAHDPAAAQKPTVAHAPAPSPARPAPSGRTLVGSSVVE